MLTFWINSILVVASLAVLMAGKCPAHAGPIPVPNNTFESPNTFNATPVIDFWQLMPQPAWWNEAATGPWTNLTGVFKNDPPISDVYIDNLDGNQGAWLYANPEVGFFQDYNSVDWNDPAPTHAFDAKFEIGRSYRLTVGIIGGGYGMLPETPLQASLYYRDPASNKVFVAATTIAYSANYFSNRTHLIDFTVTVPVVRATDPWSNQYIGIQFLSTVSPELAGGYWDLDNIRLKSTLAPMLLNPVRTNNQFQFTVQSEPGMLLEILATTNATLPALNWTSLGNLTNTTGTIPFIDTSANFHQRFYQARQMP